MTLRSVLHVFGVQAMDGAVASCAANICIVTKITLLRSGKHVASVCAKPLHVHPTLTVAASCAGRAATGAPCSRHIDHNPCRLPFRLIQLITSLAPHLL